MNENLKTILKSIEQYTSVEFARDVETYKIEYHSDGDKCHAEEYLSFWNECENDNERDEMIDELKRDIRINKDFAEWKKNNPDTKVLRIKPLTYSEKKLLLEELKHEDNRGD